jgi:hypothetical protein
MDELPGLLTDIEKVLQVPGDADSHEVDGILERLAVGNIPVNT